MGKGCDYRFRCFRSHPIRFGNRTAFGGAGCITGSLEGLVGLLLLAVAALMAAISINLYTYDRLTHESKIAEISFREIGPQHFGAIVLFKNNTKILDLRGDEWQIDARVLKWRGMAVLIGFDTLYRLDRLSGRYRDITQREQGCGQFTVYAKNKAWICG